MDKSSFVGQVINEALPALQLLVIALVGWLGKQAAAFLAARIKNEKLISALEHINDTVWSVVLELEQTLVADIKAATDEGSEGGRAITDSEYAHIKSEALLKAKTLLGTEGIKHLKEAFGLENDGALDALLSTKIEASVLQLKLEKGKAS